MLAKQVECVRLPQVGDKLLNWKDDRRGGGKTDGKGGMNSGRVRDKQLKEQGIDKIGQYIVD